MMNIDQKLIILGHATALVQQMMNKDATLHAAATAAKIDPRTDKAGALVEHYYDHLCKLVEKAG